MKDLKPKWVELDKVNDFFTTEIIVICSAD